MSAEATSQKFDPQLLLRLKSSIVMGLLVLGCVLAGSIYFSLFVMFLTWVSTKEWSKMIEPKINNVALLSMQLMAVLIIFASTYLGLPNQTLILSLVGGFLIAIVATLKKIDHPIRLSFGFVYVVYALASLLWLRLNDEFGAYLVLMVLFMIWGSDSFAYFVGKYVGGPKLAPKISPKKTWSGLLGSCFGATALLVAMSSTPILHWFGLSQPITSCSVLMAIGLVMGVLGQVGDLIISLVKRHYDLKDTGDLIPGHGGVLDRIDALIFVTPLFASLVWLVTA